MRGGIWNRLPIEQRFFSRINKSSSEIGCWLWTGYTINSGYGIIGVDCRKILTHRFSWEFHFGPIPIGIFVCHSCDIKRCVNPSHLFLGTRQENIDDMVRKGRSARGTRNGTYTMPHRNAAFLYPGRSPRGIQVNTAKLTPDKVHEIRLRASRGVRTGLLSSAFGVTPCNIRQIVRRKTWKDVQ